MVNLSKLKILVAEDHQATGEMYKRILDEKGFSVDYVHDGEEALEVASKGGYALILMDIRMPRLDGLQVLRRLQETPPEIKNGPVVMLTNLADEELVQQAMSLGALSYMDKSNLNPEQLSAKVFGVLGLPQE